MNASLLRQQLENLTEQQWQQLLAGSALEIINDAALGIGDKHSPHTLVTAAQLNVDSPQALRQQISDNAEALLQEYYRRHPLTREGFNRQVRALVQQLGPKAFAGTTNKASQYRLFVDGGEVVAEPAGSPKHPYGVQLALDLINKSNITEAVNEWIDSGEAYEDYRGMNVCRYNC